MDLVVFYWDDESEDQEIVSVFRKQEMGLGESMQRKMQGSKNKEIANVTKERNYIVYTKRKKISKFENEPRAITNGIGGKASLLYTNPLRKLDSTTLQSCCNHFSSKPQDFKDIEVESLQNMEHAFD
ncbi:hypothetical protein JHK87_000235 [Glycine soja]|nr:hypothetical protein JHK87_000235 [Glycine soja]